MDGTHTMQWGMAGLEICMEYSGGRTGWFGHWPQRRHSRAHYSRIAFGDGVCHVEISAGYGQNAAWDLWYLCAFMPVRRTIYGKTGSTQKIFVGGCAPACCILEFCRSICAVGAYGTARCAAPGTCICILCGWRNARRYDGIKCFLFRKLCYSVGW